MKLSSIPVQRFFFIGLLVAVFFIQPRMLLSKDASSKDMRVDFVIFSYDRPLQLYALLESTEEYLSGINETHVIYRSSSQDFNEGYQIVKEKFPKVLFHKQSANPHVDFKPLVLQSVYTKTSPCSYLMFGVDDIIVKDYADLEKCTKAMEKWNAWGFFLRLGKNINYTQTNDTQSPVPRGKDVGKEMFSWKFANGISDWGYPNNVDMTIYRKESIRSFLENASYTYPNTLEGRWAELAGADMEKRGLCFHLSKIVNLPINIVSLVRNRCSHAYSTQDLLVKMKQGLKIDTKDFFQIANPSAHVEYNLSFIPRE
jgi:hypothetical protein